MNLDKATAVKNEGKSLVINQSTLAHKAITGVNEDHLKFAPRISPKQKNTERMTSNESIIISGKYPGDSNSIFKKDSATGTFKQNVATTSTNTMLTSAPLILDCRKLSVRQFPSKLETSPNLDLKEHCPHLCNGIGQEDSRFQEQKLGSENKIEGFKMLSRRPSEKIEAIYRKGLSQKADAIKKIRDQNSKISLSSMPQFKHKEQNSLCNLSCGKLKSNDRKDFKVLNSWNNFDTKLPLENKAERIPKKSKISNSPQIKSPAEDCRSSQGLTGSGFSRDKSAKSSHFANFTETERAKSDSVYECVLFVAHQEFRRSGQNCNVSSDMKDAASLKAILEDIVIKPTNNSLAESEFELSKGKNPKSNTGLVVDKIKIFEDIEIVQRIKGISRRKDVAIKSNHSLKEVDESWSCSEESLKIAGSLSKEKIGGFCIESQFEKSQSFLSKNILTDKIVSNDFRILSTERPVREKIDESPSEKVGCWLIKEVNCGLKEPKPLRAVEMKRMMLLCREKIASFSNVKDGLT